MAKEKVNRRIRVSNMIKGVVSSTILVAPLTFTTLSFASGPISSEIQGDGYTVKNIREINENNVSMTFDFEKQNETIDLSIKQIDNDTSEVNVVSSTGETHTLTYNNNDSFAIMDGEKVYYNIDEFVDQDELNKSQKQARSANTPVYVSSGSISITKTVASVSALVTIVGGAIVAAKWAGVAIASGTIAGKIGDWCSMVGLGTLWAASRFDGKITYKLYKSQGLIQPPMGSKQRGYRYQDIRVIGKLKGKSMNVQLKSVGSWWFGNKPH